MRSLVAIILFAATLLPFVPARAETAALNLLFDGDSISAGAGAPPGQGLDAHVASALGGDINRHNVARGGRPVWECLHLYPTLVPPLLDPAAKYNLIIFHAGDNDVSQGRNAQQTYAAFTEYVRTAHAQGWKIVVSTELARPDFSPAKAAQLAAYNRMLVANTASADAVIDLDQDPHFADFAYRTDPSVFAPDKIHLSEAGYARMAAMLIPPIRRLTGAP